jgi:UDP-N-acetylglucosamine 4,6-dehydratase (inverting)
MPPLNSTSVHLDNASILVTGGTGSFGKAFVKTVLERYPQVRRLVVFSRDELKQFEMAQVFSEREHRCLRYFIGDVRDEKRLRRALEGIDIVIHAAALKQVPTAEYNPFECIKTNVLGSQNLIDACLDSKVRRVVALSTDKAAAPINLYGATKLCADKLFVAANNIRGSRDISFSVVRYGNVMGSRGSVIPLFQKLAPKGEIPITDERMTRFMITLEQGVELVWHAFQDSVGGEIYVKKIPSMKVVDIAKAIAPGAKLKIIGIRPGEKLHEQMISTEDAYYTYEYAGHYKILPAIHEWSSDPARIGEGRRVAEGFCYSSDNNPEWMAPESLKRWVDTELSNVTV